MCKYFYPTINCHYDIGNALLLLLLRFQIYRSSAHCRIWIGWGFDS